MVWYVGSHLLCHLTHRLDTGPIQVVIVLARLDELVILDVFLHLLSQGDKVIVSAVYLVFSLWSGCV